MKDIWEEPYSETDEYYVFFSNVMGSISTVTVMRKDKEGIGEARLSIIFVSFIKVVFDEFKHEWHENVNMLPEKPFNEDWAIEQYKQHREAAFN